MNIPIKEKSVQDEISNIIPKIYELDLKLKQLEKENAELAKKVNFLMEQEEKREKELNEEKKQINNFFKESSIIKFEDKQFILNLLANKPARTKLLYDSSINGDTGKNFHLNCDGKSPTIYIVKSSTGYIFGGYLSQPWASGNEYFEDNNAFFFSINLKKKYIFTNKKEVYFGNPDYGPVIRGGIEMDIFNKSQGNFVRLENENQGSKYEINGGSMEFNYQNYEVFQLEY